MPNNTISLDTYDIFKEVYENGNLARTAEKLHIAQPSISYRIKLLEDSLNIRLFNRMPGGMEPTIYADELYNNIKSALETIKCTERNMLEGKINGKGDIFIGVQHHIGKYYLTSTLKKYNAMYPNIKIHVINKGTETLVDLLEHGKLDLIVDTLPISARRNKICIKEIDTFHTCFAKIKGAPKKYILPVVGSTMRTEIEKMLQTKGILIEPTFEIYTTEMTIEMIKEKIGVAYTIREFLEHEKIEELEFVDILSEMPLLTLCVAYVDRKQSYAVRQFLNLTRMCIKM